MRKKIIIKCKNCGKSNIIELNLQLRENFRFTCKNCGYVSNVLLSFGTVQPFNKIDFLSSRNKSSMIFKSSKEKINEWIQSVESFFYEKKMFFLTTVAITFIILGFLVIFFYFSVQFNKEAYFEEINKNYSNQIYDRNGKILSELFQKKNSTLSYEEIPEQMKRILLFVEDQNFFSHGGINYKSLVRAIITNIISFGYVQGASTITQQLARILLGEREKKISRKIKEAFLAFELEDNFTKEEILTFYVNLVYLGHGAYGFENAAKFYFRKHPKELNFIETLVLVSLASRPEYYSPFRNFNHLEKKIDSIYERILQEKPNFSYPDKKTYLEQKEKLKTSLNRSPYESVFGTRIDFAPYVTEFVRKKIELLLGKEYTTSMGLKIYTNIDRDLQIAASEESYLHLENLRKSHPYKIDEKDLTTVFEKHYLESGIGSIFFGMPLLNISKQQLETASIGIDPKTGEVLFMQGGSLFQANNQFNRAIQMYRQTGSSIKPIIYAAAIEAGILNPASILEDSPLYFPLSETTKGYWVPENIDKSYEGKIPLREALEKSRNIPALIATQKVGFERLAEHYKKFFFHTESEFKRRFKEETAIGIGILEMSPLEMAIAYSVFANNGFIKRPYLIKKIEDSNGNILYEGSNQDEFNLNIVEGQIISGDTAEVMIDLLRSSARFGGTGIASERLAGKTGTTNKYRDAWFIGILPTLTTAVWVGFDDPKVSMNNGTGATVAGPLYGNIMKRVLQKYDQGEYSFFPNAVHVEICPKSGKLPNPYCPVKKIEIFTREGIPEEECDVHKPEERKIHKKSDFE